MTLKTVCCLTIAAALLAPSGAFARNKKNVLTAMPVPVAAVDLGYPTPQFAMRLEEVALTRMVPSSTGGEAPSVLKPLQRLSCVPYARLRSGLQIFGDARLWWDKARSLYTQLATPVSEAVMVFSGSKKISHGHVAVVTQVVSPREIKVDHANWQNHGEIDLNMPVLDVSPKNDWSEVRVWNVNTNSFGSHVYQISGFISKTGTAN